MNRHLIIGICGVITFIIPLIQLSIGFNQVVDDGHDANKICRAASDLPLLLAIGGIFALFFLGTAYGFLAMIASIDDKQSDISGKTPKILLGLVSFSFGAITFIFFILIQMRVYGAYSNGVQFNNQTATNYCRSTVMGGGLAMIILTYINVLIFTSIVIFVIVIAYTKRKEKKQENIDMNANNN
ncbi:unnamed protein product [Adineta steineri]|uniref:Uncharacterized protein n=1 Tax=Adineta steineri TaxID=433720 RepID=A0A813SIV5_9BILA|nr:unnamed protein product [Adineta steineri]CAF0886520.1 unnamed protein product [Adineta steineri]CAF3546081.1 unnamed protein product [Adineta steineri]CAF3929332.1 unnamed protein product [Adineta steineri]